MKNKIIRKNQFITSTWSGGTTTELYIYPEDAKYSDRNFKWRLSSAKVEVEESEFTHLPGISRIIMIIDGELILEHEGHHKAILKPFEQDSFMGDWTTKSFGKVTDFNLMMAEGCSGKLEAIMLKGNECTHISLKETKGKSEYITNAFYTVSGYVSFTIGNNKTNIYEGDLLLLTRAINDEDCAISIDNNIDKESCIIRAIVFY